MRRRSFIGGFAVGFALTLVGGRLVDRPKQPKQTVRLLPSTQVSYIDRDAKITYLGWSDKFPRAVRTPHWVSRPNLDN